MHLKEKTTRALETIFVHSVYGPPYGTALGSPVSVVVAEIVMQTDRETSSSKLK